MTGSITKQIPEKRIMEHGPRKVGLMSSFASLDPRLFKKAESSKRHQSRVLQVGSQSTIIFSDRFKIPPKLKMLAFFSSMLFLLMQIRSKKTGSRGRQRSKTTTATTKPLIKDQLDHFQSGLRGARTIPGKMPKLNRTMLMSEKQRLNLARSAVGAYLSKVETYWLLGRTQDSSRFFKEAPPA